MGEPQRFEMFLDEMMKRPFWFYGVVPLRHTASQTYFLSTFYGSNIDFIGKVEHYNDHWVKLLNHDKCKWFKNKTNIMQHADIEHVVQGMYHYGFDIPFYSRTDKRRKYKEYIDRRE